MTATLARGDVGRLLGALALLALGGVLWWYLREAFFPLRVLAVVVAVVAAVVVAWTTQPGSQAVGFLQEVQLEVRRVVWPTRPQTVQMTGLVIAMVLVMALLLWFLDWLLGGLIEWLIY